jgi:hypothetical protein
LITPPIAEEGTVLFDNEPFHLWPLGFNILLIDSVITYEWICHNDDLTFIGRIGHDLLVTCHAGIEDHFSRLLSWKPERPSFEDRSIL